MARSRKRIGMGRVVGALEELADPSLAQEWDNVGLLAGDRGADCSGVLLCIDMAASVVDEAVKRSANLIAAYHPPIFRATKRLVADSRETDALVLRALHHGLHLYSMHTALDAAEGGTNDVIARLAGLDDVQPFEDVAGEAPSLKVVTFVPHDVVDRVSEAMFAAGGGRIGDYEKCSYRLSGEGTFFGTEGTDPTVGRRGRLECVPEIRLEAVTPRHAIARVLDAIRRAHPYEEVPIDVYPLEPSRRRAGIGRVGELSRATTLETLARKLKKAVGAPTVQVVGRGKQRVRKLAVCVGSAGRLPDAHARCRDCDAVVTGEVSHHDALYWSRRTTGDGRPTGVVALGHWHSERPVLADVAARLRKAVAGLTVGVSRADGDPVRFV